MRKKISTIIAICAASVLLMTSMDAVAVSTTDDVVNNETAATSMGDVNIDGTFDAADVVLLQKWLLAIPDRERIQELLHFINSQPRTITEFDEVLVKKLLESVKVCEFFLEFRFKSGVTVSVEK